VEPRDPSREGSGLSLETDGDGAGEGPQDLVLRPRALAWAWIVPIFLCGLILASCNLFLYLAPEQAGSDSRSFFVAVGLLGLGILAAPLLNFVNAEVRYSNGLVTKRGVFRTVQRWQASDLDRIYPYVRYLGRDEAEFLHYVVYRFMLKGGGIAFDMTQAWWKTSDIEALAKALHLYIPPRSVV
jgi:hypothetical protein